jgi:hypothetical protein
MNLKTCTVETEYLNILSMQFKLGEIKQRNCCKLFIYGILNEAVRSSEYAASDDRMNNQFGMK